MNTLTTALRIKTLCKEKKIAIKIMLEQTDISRNFMYDLRNNRIPSADKFEKIADYLDCSVDYLLGRTENPEVNK